MVVEAGSVTFGTTGAHTISLGTITGVPKGVLFFTGSKFGVNETATGRQGSGFSDSNYEWATAMLENASGKFTRNYPGTEAFAVLDGTSGNPVVLGSVTSFGTAQINVNLTNADSNYQIGLLVWADS